MGKIIYGVDSDGKITVSDVLGALEECFYQAHCAATELGLENKDSARQYCEMMVKKAFSETNGDVDNPTKESLVAAMNKLAQLSENFRTNEEIQQHYKEIMELVEKIEG